ncbi:hypothetical protein [Salinimicrobium oceani]|uniref:PH domain-containing protein n=1 Tax=Salinimicrobium oceani TaxID=2722702 RepID=A0ABX1CXB7_9FLAO|nr:hypothetical protein [Salinimicrobium oceani]NJW51301.1 hypothetical protein [Salinimicrobium oceani]
MTIRYSKKAFRRDLILGSVFLIFGIFFIAEEPDNVIRYGFLVVSLLHLISGLYQLKMPYLKLENGKITKGGLISKSIPLSEVVRIRKFAGDYTLYTSDKKLKINSELVNKTELNRLDELMRSIDVPLDETPPKDYKHS